MKESFNYTKDDYPNKPNDKNLKNNNNKQKVNKLAKEHATRLRATSENY